MLSGNILTNAVDPIPSFVFRWHDTLCKTGQWIDYRIRSHDPGSDNGSTMQPVKKVSNVMMLKTPQILVQSYLMTCTQGKSFYLEARNTIYHLD